FFFFQAEDGIRDATVTGVQTCALPIFAVVDGGSAGGRNGGRDGGRHGAAEDGRRPAAVGLDPDARRRRADARDRGRRGARFAEDLSAAAAGGGATRIAASGALDARKASAFAGKGSSQAGPYGSRNGREGQLGMR